MRDDVSESLPESTDLLYEGGAGRRRLAAEPAYVAGTVLA